MKNNRGIIFAVVASVVLTACGGAQTRYANHMERGKQYLAGGNLDKASVEFRNALQIVPTDAEARYLNGKVAEKRGNIREALGMYQGAIDAKPDYAAARAAQGRIFVFGGASARAMQAIEPALAKYPDDPDLLTVRSAVRAQQKNMSGAVADAELAVKLAPRNADAVALLASLYQRQGDAARAIQLVDSGVRQQTDQAVAIDLRHILVSLYLATDQSGKAEDELKTILKLKPDALSYRMQLAAFYASGHRLDDAQRVLEEAVRALPANNDAKLALVEFIAKQRSREQGEKALRAYIARQPDNNDLRLGLGALLQRVGAPQDAITVYDELITRDSKAAAALLARDRIAAIQMAMGHSDEAQKLIAQVLQKNPRDNDALLMRGNIALERHDPTTAIVDLRAVLRDQPNAVGVQRSLARAYVENGEPALAEQTLRAAVDATPADTSARLELAQLLGESGHIDAAITLLEDSVRRMPNDARMRESLIRAYIGKRDWPAATSAVHDLETLQPQAAAGPYLAGVIAQSENHPEESQKDFERALDLQPAAMDALAALTRLQLARGQGAAALSRVQIAVKADAGNAVANNLLGELLIATKAYSQAIEQLTRTVGLAPKWWLPYRNLAMARFASGDIGGSTAAYEAGIKAAPGEATLVTELAALYERQGRIDEAIAQYAALNAHDPHSELAANNLAMLLVTYKTDQRSLEHARDLTAAFGASDSATLLDTHGWVRFKEGDVNDALPVLERASSRSPQSRVIRYHLAMAELKAGQRDKARTNLETALSGAATFAGSNEARAALASLTTGRAS